jgi:hypothetical protein
LPQGLADHGPVLEFRVVDVAAYRYIEVDAAVCVFQQGDRQTEGQAHRAGMVYFLTQLEVAQHDVVLADQRTFADRIAQVEV